MHIFAMHASLNEKKIYVRTVHRTFEVYYRYGKLNIKYEQKYLARYVRYVLRFLTHEIVFACQYLDVVFSYDYPNVNTFVLSFFLRSRNASRVVSGKIKVQSFINFMPLSFSRFFRLVAW